MWVTQDNRCYYDLNDGFHGNAEQSDCVEKMKIQLSVNGMKAEPGTAHYFDSWNLKEFWDEWCVVRNLHYRSCISLQTS